VEGNEAGVALYFGVVAADPNCDVHEAEKTLRGAHSDCGRSASLQLLAMAAAMASVCVTPPIPRPVAHHRGTVFSVALLRRSLNTFGTWMRQSARRPERRIHILPTTAYITSIFNGPVNSMPFANPQPVCKRVIMTRSHARSYHGGT
jgi:hypothetical protein